VPPRREIPVTEEEIRDEAGEPEGEPTEGLDAVPPAPDEDEGDDE
jgi:hypothetical protein